MKKKNKTQWNVESNQSFEELKTSENSLHTLFFLHKTRSCMRCVNWLPSNAASVCFTKQA